MRKSVGPVPKAPYAQINTGNDWYSRCVENDVQWLNTRKWAGEAAASPKLPNESFKCPSHKAAESARSQASLAFHLALQLHECFAGSSPRLSSSPKTERR